MSSVGEPLVASFVEAFDHVWSRFTTRLNGLDDDEYFWEPVAGCWTLRIGDDGQWQLDGHGRGRPAPDPAPVTTIAWRIGHLGGSTLDGFARRLFADRSPAAHDHDLELASNASDAVELLEHHYVRWRTGISALDDASFGRSLGRGWGPYSDSTVTDLALHVFDEVAHHAAEIGLLRDLYASRSGSATVGERVEAP